MHQRQFHLSWRGCKPAPQRSNHCRCGCLPPGARSPSSEKSGSTLLTTTTTVGADFLANSRPALRRKDHQQNISFSSNCPWYTDTSLGYCTFLMLRIMALRKRRRAGRKTNVYPCYSADMSLVSNMIKCRLDIFCWRCSSAALKSQATWSNASQCFLL